MRMVCVGCALMLIACGSDDRNMGIDGADALTNAQVCDRIVTAACETGIRCGAWADTASACRTATYWECCADEQCDWPAAGTVAQANACAAQIRGSACETNDDGQVVIQGESCQDLVGIDPPPVEEPGRPAGRDLDPVRLGDNSSTPLHSHCRLDFECGADAESCLQAFGYDESFRTTRGSICSNRCDGNDDTWSCGPGAVCAEAPSSEDQPAICYASCVGDSDCPLELRCRQGRFGNSNRYCAP